MTGKSHHDTLSGPEGTRIGRDDVPNPVPNPLPDGRRAGDSGTPTSGDRKRNEPTPGEEEIHEEEVIDLDDEEAIDLGRIGMGEEEGSDLDVREETGRPEEKVTVGKKVGREDQVSLSSEGERAALLASVLRHDAERKEAQATVPSRGPKPLGPQLVGLALSTALAVYVWFGSPSWLIPEPVPLPPLAVETADVRAAVWLGAQQVEAFERRNGRIPGPQEIGLLPPGVRYERRDARSYLLVGHGERVTVPYSSGEPRDQLLSAARQILEAVESQ